MPDDERPLEAIWQEYAERYLPDDAEAIQRQETKRAIFYGAAKLFDRIMALPENDQQAANALYTAIVAERRQFAFDVTHGRA